MNELRAPYRRCFFDSTYGGIVFADLIDRSGIFNDLFANGDRHSPGIDNAYLEGRRSIVLEMLEIMGITEPKKIAEALSNVLPDEAGNQIIAEEEDE